MDRHHRAKVGPLPTACTADPAKWFAETNNTNDSTWVNIRLTNSGVSVLATGQPPDMWAASC